jgi:hypothetical protein
MRRYTLPELEALPTIHAGHTDDLKVETATERLWLSRCTVADGEPCNNKVTVEQLTESGRWVQVDSYEALAWDGWDRYGFVFRRPL